jgi:hypothetical protein
MKQTLFSRLDKCMVDLMSALNEVGDSLMLLLAQACGKSILMVACNKVNSNGGL